MSTNALMTAGAATWTTNWTTNFTGDIPMLANFSGTATEMFGSDFVQQVAKLFEEAQEASGESKREHFEDEPREPAFMTPADLAEPNLPGVKVAKPANLKDPDDIFGDSDVDDDVLDDRAEPVYEIRYGQSLSANDAYLGLDWTKSPASSGCDRLVVIIDLPACRERSEIALDVTRELLDLRHPCYRLRVQLPQPILEGQGAAEWDGSKKQLRVTLHIDTSRRVFKFL